jgi:hypothetical protein
MEVDELVCNCSPHHRYKYSKHHSAEPCFRRHCSQLPKPETYVIFFDNMVIMNGDDRVRAMLCLADTAS